MSSYRVAVLVAGCALSTIAFCPSHSTAQRNPPVVRRIADTDSAWTHGIAEPASGRFIVYANHDALQIVDRKSGKTTRVPARLIESAGGSISISASGRRLVYVAADETARASYVWSLDLDTLTGKPVSSPHRVGIVPSHAASISDDGRWIAFASSRQPGPITPSAAKLFIIPSDGGDERLLDSAARIQTPRWTPDGKTIYYVRGRGRGPGLARISVAGGKPDSLAPTGRVIGVSRDGRRIAFMSPVGGRRVSISDADGRILFNVTVAPTYNPLTWSRSEPSAIFGGRLVQSTSFKMVSLGNGKIAPYPGTDRQVGRPAYSRDGRRLAYISIANDRANLVVEDAATHRRTTLSAAVEPDADLGMRWSPDGTRIAFLALDSSFTQHELWVISATTGQAMKLADFGPARGGNATLYGWRADGSSIDYITGTSPQGDTDPMLERVTLAGGHSVVRALPRAPNTAGTTGGYHLINDSLVVIGRDVLPGGGSEDSSYLALFNSRTGETRMLARKAVFWLTTHAQNILSPDGRWLAMGSIGVKDGQRRPQWAAATLDGSAFRVLGEAMGCDAWPVEWLPDSRSYLAIGQPSCTSSGSPMEYYIVPIDGSAARRLTVPANEGSTLTSDGRSLLIAADESKSGSLIALDVSKASTAAVQTGAPRKAGKKR